MEADRSVMAHLIQLSKLDQRIYDLTDEKNQKPKKIAQDKKAIQALQTERQKLEDSIKAKQLLIHQKELELKELSEKIRKQENRLNEIKSNKEYSAVRSEIGNLKADTDVLEDEVLRQMEDLDTLKETLQKHKQLEQKELEKFQAKDERVQASLRHLNEEFETVTREREEAVKLVPEIVYSYYYRILDRNHGKSVAAVKEGVCQGCYCGLTPQDQNLLLIQKELVICKSCSRILYSEKLFEE